MCAKHWRMVPDSKKRAVLHYYKKGQEVSKTPTREWHMAADNAIYWVHIMELREKLLALSE